MKTLCLNLCYPAGGEHTLRLIVLSEDERVLAVGEEDEGEVASGGEDGGVVVEDAVGVPRLQTAPEVLFTLNVICTLFYNCTFKYLYLDIDWNLWIIQDVINLVTLWSLWSQILSPLHPLDCGVQMRPQECHLHKQLVSLD